MKKLFLIFIFLMNILTFGQDSGLLLRYGDEEFSGDLFALGGIGLKEVTGMALRLTPPVPFTLTQTGIGVQAILDGTFATRVIINGSFVSVYALSITNSNSVGSGLQVLVNSTNNSRFVFYLNTGAGDILKITNAGNSVWNEGGSDFDSRWETNNNDKTLFINGGTDAIGIHTDSPTTTLQIGATSADDVQPDFSIVGDADGDAGGDTDDIFKIALIPNANPTLATWDFTTTQSNGWKYNGNVEITGNLTVAGTTSKTGEMFWDENASVTVMETINSPIGLRFASTGTESGFTFDAGGTGAITAFSDGGGGTVDAADVAHGLVTGDFVVIRGTTSYNGVFQITRIDDDNFTITDTFVSDDGASDWEEPSYLQLTTGTSEVFSMDFSMSILKAGGGSSTVNVQAYLGITAQTKSLAELTIAGTDIEPVGCGQLITMSSGNRLFFILQATNTNNLTVKHGNVKLLQN